jgi:hypothetical protein
MPRFIATILVLYVMGSPPIADALPGDFGKALRSFHDASNEVFVDPRSAFSRLVPARPGGQIVEWLFGRRIDRLGQRVG